MKNQLLSFSVKASSNAYLYFLICFLLVFLMSLTRAFSPYTSPFDEHTHLSYVQYAFNWIIPAEGYPMNSWAKSAFSCHPHAIYGAMTKVPCGQIGDGRLYPTGGTNTSQTWPPIYFFIVAILMRLPLLFFSDPLISARIVTAFLWSIGAAWLSFQASKLADSKLVGIGAAALLASLPTFFYYNSSVSPHSLNPLIIATFLFISLKIINRLTDLPITTTENQVLKAFSFFFSSKWPYLFLLFGLVVAFTIFQALDVLGFEAVFLVVSIINIGGISKKLKFVFTVCTAILTGITAICFVKIFSFWQWQMHERRVAFPPDVNVSGANSDPADPAYISPIIRIFARIWSFWPQVFDPGFPLGKDVSAVTSFWIFILGGLSVTAVVVWNKSSWLSPYMLSLLVAAPVFSIAYDYFFTTDVPVRYGLAFSIIGVFGLANLNIHKFAKKLIVGFAVMTYITAFVLNPGYIEAKNCNLDSATSTIRCL